MSDTLVIGLGNPLRGDDGVGVQVAQMLARRALPDGVEVVDAGSGGLELANLMEGWPRVILIDAAYMGKEPGEFSRFTFDEVGSGAVRLAGDSDLISVHAAGLRDALLLAEVLGVLPEQVIIFGVQPARVEWETRLSPEVEAALPALIGRVMEELESDRERSEDAVPGGHTTRQESVAQVEMPHRPTFKRRKDRWQES